MSNSRYLEFDSTYRNRNDWPLPGEFVIPFSMSGRKGQIDALDPVSTSVPTTQWTGGYFDLGISPPTGLIAVSVNPYPGGTPFINAATDTSTLVLTAAGGTGNRFQELDNYYTNAVLEIQLTGGSVTYSRRIVSYKYLGLEGTSDKAQVTVSPAFNDAVISTSTSSTGNIYDPTDLSDLNNPYFFVPPGSLISNAYAQKILYNETHNEFRKIKNYDSTTGLLSVDTTGTTTSSSGPLPTTAGGTPIWSRYDNYSIRTTPPILPALDGTNPTVLANHTYAGVTYNTSTTTVIINNITLPSNFNLKNYVIRLIPNAVLAGGSYYKYINGVVNPTPLNQDVLIDSYVYDSAAGVLVAITINPTLLSTPTTGTYVELLPFSYDNANPFVYTGSQVSQQESVCYEMKLINVILPNLTLKTGFGGRIAFYPYVYVTISNYPYPSGGLNNIIYSNNPNSNKVIFRAPIYDISSPLVSSFVNLDGDSMVQTIKFKPNDNLYFSVTFPNGDVFETIITDTVSPAPPNPYIQVSACFEIKRVTNNPISSIVGR